MHGNADEAADGHVSTGQLPREEVVRGLLLDAYDADVREGRGHSGVSALVDLVARRPGH